MKSLVTKILLPAIFLLAVSEARPQSGFSSAGSVTGIIRDKANSESLPFTTVELCHASDSTYAGGGLTDSIGQFTIGSLPFGSYFLRISYVGYENHISEIFSINASAPAKNMGAIKMNPSAALLKTVNIEGKQPTGEVKGDTVQYNASSYKTHPDANAEDLVTKMPGITSDNGTVKAHGEDVKKVLVDGKPFFGDDPSLALKNIPAEVIDKIQVFDKASDQAQFTGFDDGNASKTINIITKPGKNNGTFGKIYSGYGTDDRFIDGGNINIFKGERRISILGLSNNINQQNFSTQDLLGVTGGGSGGRSGGRGGAAGGTNFGAMGGGASSNFLVGSQPGISTTNAAGFNYSDKWGEKIKVTASYFFNNTNNENITMLTRNYITSKTSGQQYDESDDVKNTNFNHRINTRFEYALDTMNALILTPKISFQNNHALSFTSGESVLPENVILSNLYTGSDTKTNGYSLSNNILFQHKFNKKGRTFSINLGTDENKKAGSGTFFSNSEYLFPSDTLVTVDQNSRQNTNGYTLSSGITYTEPIDSSSQLMISYNPSYTYTRADKETFGFDPSVQDYSYLDTALSSKFNSTYLVNKGGVSYRKNKKKFSIMATINYQYATLAGNEEFPSASKPEKNFTNVLPQAMFNYSISQGHNLRIFYRTSTNTPSISQLQDVVNNSNPLFLSSGNPYLKQDYEHTLTARYGKTNLEKATGLFAFAYFNIASNYISNSTFTAKKDSVLSDGLAISRGSQFTQPVNLNGYRTARSLVTYSLPVSFIKSNINLSSGFSYTRTPALINNENDISSVYNVSGGIGISSNISEKIDFNVNTTSNYNSVINSLQSSSNNHYFSQITTLKLNLVMRKVIVFNTNLSHSVYRGLSQSYDQNFLIWNASLAYKFLKNKSLEIKGTVSDILNQNNNINRTVTETYTEDSRTNALKQYYLLTLTYNFRYFKKPDSSPVK